MRCFKVCEGYAGEWKADTDLPTLYGETECDCIDIAVRRVNGRPYNVVVDDMGLLKGLRPSAVSTRGTEVLVGPILVFGYDEEGDLRGLTDEELADLGASVMTGIYGGEEVSLLVYDF